MSEVEDLVDRMGALNRNVRWITDRVDGMWGEPGSAPNVEGPVDALAAAGYRSCLALVNTFLQTLGTVLVSRRYACVALTMRRPVLEWCMRAEHVERTWSEEKARKYKDLSKIGASASVSSFPDGLTISAWIEGAPGGITLEKSEREALHDSVHGGVAVFVGGISECHAKKVYTDESIAQDIKMLGQASFLAGERLMRLLGGEAVLEQLDARRKRFEAE